MGHIPPGVYDVPHVDVHFEMGPIADIFAIEPGPCGPEFVRCDQFQTTRKPLPPNYVAPDYVDVEAVVPAMGNHLVDTTGPEFQKQPFTRSWIYGVYDGRVIFDDFYARYVALPLAVEMFATIVTVHGSNGWLFTNKDGGWEYPAFWAVALIVLFLLGDGVYALKPTSDAEN